MSFKYYGIPCSIQEKLETPGAGSLQSSFGNHPVAPQADDLPTYAWNSFRQHSIYSFDRFKTAVDDLETQYLKIRRARKDLCKWDPPGDAGFGIKIDYSTLRDEMIDWEL